MSAQQDKSFYENAKQIASSGTVDDRIKLCQNAKTPKEILYFLTSDPDEEVREAVALSPNTPYQAYEILALDKSERVRMALLRTLSSSDQDFSKDEDQKSLIEVVVQKLAVDPSLAIRRALANFVRRLKFISREIVMILARDPDDEVSSTVVRSSPVLSREDLLELIQERRESTIVAMAGRQDVDEEISAGVVEVGFSPAVTQLLSNSSAKMSGETLEFLADSAEDHEEWHGAFAHREGLSLDVIKKLSLFISNTLIKVLLEQNVVAKDQLKEVVDIIKKRVESGELDAEVLGVLSEPPQEFIGAYDRAKDDYIKGKLNEHSLTKRLKAKDRTYVIGGLAVLAAAPYDVVLRAINTQSQKAITAFTWKAGLTPQFAVVLQRDLAMIPGEQILWPSGGDFPLNDMEMEWQIELFYDSV